MIQQLHNYFKPLPYFSVKVIHPLEYEKTPPHLLWFPFQEEYNHNMYDKINTEETLQTCPSMIPFLRNSHRIFSQPEQVRTYYKQLEVGLRFSHIYRSTDWTEFNEAYWWHEEKQFYTFPYQPEQQNRTLLFLYQTESQKHHQEFVLLWAWDCFSVPFLYPSTNIPLDTTRFLLWKEFIKQLWTVILQQPNYLKVICNNKAVPIVYVAIPPQGWDLFSTLLEQVFLITPELSHIQWRYITNYPLRVDNKVKYLTEQPSNSSPPPPSLQFLFNELLSIDFQSIPTRTFYPWKETISRIPFRLDGYDLYQWTLWFRIIEQSWHRLIHRKPIIHHSIQSIQWIRSPWNQWLLLYKNTNEEVSINNKTLFHIAYEAQKGNLPFIFLRKDCMDQKQLPFAWRGTFWFPCTEEEADGCFINCCMISKRFSELEPFSIDKCIKLYNSLRSIFPQKFPEWIPSKFLYTNREDVPSRMATQ
jgi:hypothetical protein